MTAIRTLVALSLALIPYTVWAGSMQLPVGKCRYPLPSMPGFNVTSMEGTMFKYLYTPTAMVYKAVDSISMMIKSNKAQPNMYTEYLKARSILGTPTTMKFLVKDLGDGIMKKIVKDENDSSYVASIVAIKGDVGLLYVCSDDGEETGEDFRYVIARKWVKPELVKHPDIMFRAVNEKYKFKGKFRRLPQRWGPKLF